MHSTLHLHIELYVCMYFIACYYEPFYMNCNIDICVTCVTVNELWKDKQHI